MRRVWKALPLTLAIAALAALSIVAIACNSSNGTRARFINAIQNAEAYGGTLDVEVNGAVDFTGVTFGTPSAATYTGIPAGNDTIEGFESPGETTEVFTQSASLTSGSQYTLVATGFAGGTGGNVVLMSLVDNNTAPTDGYVNFRVIDASPSQGNVDIYIVPNPSNGGNLSSYPKAFSNLAYNDPSAYTYYKIPYNSSATPPYTMYVTSAGNTTPLFNFSLTAGSASVGAIRTVVLTDVENGGEMSSEPIVLDDLN